MSERSRIRTIGLASYSLAVASVLWGYSVLLYLLFGFTHYTVSDPGLLAGRSWRVFLFEWTRPDSIAYLSGCIGIAAVTGGLGYALAHRERRDGKLTLAASAARLARGGLVGVVLDLAILSLMLGYRAYRWFA
jgi:hypothetical protein